MIASNASATEMPRTGRVAISVETLLYAAIFGAALVLRSISLYSPSLSGFEVGPAVTASNWIAVPEAGSPVVYGATALSFALFGASNASARLAPMLAGIALVASPLLFRRQFGRIPTAILCALLALSPGAVAASRQVNGIVFSMLGFVLFLATLLGYLNSRRSVYPLLAGVALGASLAADFGIILVIATATLGGLFAYATDDEGELAGVSFRSILQEFSWTLFLVGFAGTLLILSTGFFANPGGLGAAANQLSYLITGLLHQTSGTPWLGLVLGIYELALVIFGATGIWLCSQAPSAWKRFLAGWGFTSVALTLIFSSALPLHALWAILPLAALSAQSISALAVMRERSPSWAPWIHAGGVLAFVGMIFGSLSQYLRNPKLIPLGQITGNTETGIPVDLVLTIVWVVLLIILWLTVASMWEPRTAWKGLGFGTLIVVVGVTFGQSASLATIRADSPYELYNVEPAQPGLRVMIKTMEELGNLAVGNPQDASITIQGTPDSVIGWAVRDFHDVTFVDRADATVDSVMVITPTENTDPTLGSSYVGQDRTIVQAWLPRDLTLPDFLKWVLYRSAPPPASEQRVILWVREDIYRLASDEPDVHP